MVKMEFEDEDLKVIAKALYHFYWGCIDYDWLSLSGDEMDDLAKKSWKLFDQITDTLNIKYP